MGSVSTPIGNVPRVSTSLTWADRIGSYKARWGVGRMDYMVDPGLYALGEPLSEDPVLVTANYKMSFDRLRVALPGRNAWILVLDTKGINVWCAAGKGTFGTDELVARIRGSGLERVVSHKRLILPQLSAPGVSAHEVRKLSGFNVIYGPIRAKDLPAFFDAGLKAAPEMRIKTFPASERLVLIPIELVSALKTAVFILPVLFLLGGLGGPAGFWENATRHGFFADFAFLVSVLAGTVLTPLLLPWLPGRAFALKGLAAGAATALLIACFGAFDFARMEGLLAFLGWLFMISAVSAYLGMNFTGASTYTSLSGVRKEMRWALPLEIIAAVGGFVLWVASRFMT